MERTAHAKLRLDQTSTSCAHMAAAKAVANMTWTAMPVSFLRVRVKVPCSATLFTEALDAGVNRILNQCQHLALRPSS